MSNIKREFFLNKRNNNENPEINEINKYVQIGDFTYDVKLDLMNPFSLTTFLRDLYKISDTINLLIPLIRKNYYNPLLQDAIDELSPLVVPTEFQKILSKFDNILTPLNYYYKYKVVYDNGLRKFDTMSLKKEIFKLSNDIIFPYMIDPFKLNCVLQIPLDSLCMIHTSLSFQKYLNISISFIQAGEEIPFFIWDQLEIDNIFEIEIKILSYLEKFKMLQMPTYINFEVNDPYYLKNIIDSDLSEYFNMVYFNNDTFEHCLVDNSSNYSIRGVYSDEKNRICYKDFVSGDKSDSNTFDITYYSDYPSISTASTTFSLDYHTMAHLVHNPPYRTIPYTEDKIFRTIFDLSNVPNELDFKKYKSDFLLAHILYSQRKLPSNFTKIICSITDSPFVNNFEHYITTTKFHQIYI